MMPWKTILTAVLFTAAMARLKVFDPHTIPLVWQMPLPQAPVIAGRLRSSARSRFKAPKRSAESRVFESRRSHA